jgi:myo-inositol 2-dehydrogenase / D-chiro-inositol 1-dehydrogenase
VLGAGAALFVEKPLALDAPTAERIADTARKAGVLTAVGHHWRYSPAVDLVRELLDGRPVRVVAGSWIDRVPPVAWWSRRALSGGQIVEQAVHVLDMIRLLCGDVVEVNAYANAAPPRASDADIDGATVAILKLQSGAVGTVTATCCVDWKHRAGLELHADGLSVTFREDCITTRTAQGTTQRSLLPDDAKRAADRAFIDAVVGNGSARGGVLVDYEEALRTHQLACAIATSAAHNRPVRLDG